MEKEKGEKALEKRSSLFGAEITDEDKKKVNVFRFASSGEKWLMAGGTVAMTIAGAALPAFALIFGELIDGLYNPDLDEAADQVQNMAFMFLLVGVGLWVFIAIGMSLWGMIAIKQTLAVRKEFVWAFLNQDMEWFDKQGTDVAAEILTESNNIQDGLGDKFSNTIMFIATAVFGIIAGFIRGWKLTLVILACMPVLVVAGFLIMKIMMASGEENPYTAAGIVATEYLSAIRTVQSFSLQSVAESKYGQQLKRAKEKAVKKSRGIGAVLGFVWLGMFSAYALALWFGSTMIADKEENPQTGEPWTGGDVLAVFFCVLMGGMSLGQAGPGFQGFEKAKESAARIWKVIDRKPSIDVRSRGAREIAFGGKIALDNVTFAYPTAPTVQVLKGVSLTINPGQFVALVGPSGSGKSTIISLLERFYQPASGRVTIGSVDYNQLDLQTLRENIGLVTQEPTLFNTTIKQNIAYGKKNATMKEIEAAAKEANCHEFIMKLPLQYDTLVGQAGSQLSGGQKQRVAIARAIIRNPAILLLDEATSALDSTSEHIVQEALERVMKGKTVIAIAHRLSTIRNADKVVVLSEGRVVEEGTHEELMAKKGLFHNLTQQQTLGSGTDGAAAHTAAAADPAAAALDSSGPDYSRNGEKRGRGGSVEKKENDEEEEEEIPWETHKSNTLRLVKSMGPVWHWVILGLVMSMLNGVIMPAFSIVFTEMLKVFYKCVPVNCAFNQTLVCYDGRLSESRCLDDLEDDASIVSWMFFVLAVTGFFSNLFMVLSFSVIGQTMTIKLRKQVFGSLLRQDIGFHDDPKNSTGALTARLETDAESINNVVSLSSGLNVQNLTSLVAGLSLAFLYSWEMALLLLGMLPAIALAGLVQFQAMQGSNTESRDSREQANLRIQESVDGFRVVTAFNLQEEMQDTILNEVSKSYGGAIKTAVVTAMAFGLSNFMMFAMYGIAFSLGAHLIREGERSPDAIMKVFFALAMAAMGIGQTAGVAPDSSKFRLSSQSVFRIIDTRPKIDNNDNNLKNQISRLDGKISLNNVTFSYPMRPTVKATDDLSLTISPGSTVAFVGPSGCGKSTIVRLIERFYDPTHGSLSVDDVNIKDVNVHSLRERIGIVEQEPTLFTGTIAENILMGKINASQQEVEQAARDANAHDFIQTLENKYETMIGTSHSQLSGGQKQRVAIARALIRNPEILLLDEATSALDSKSEQVVNEVLKQCTSGRTTVMIAHRLSTVQHADTIFVVDQGKVVEQGTHSALIDQGGLYASLVEQQQLSAE